VTKAECSDAKEISLAPPQAIEFSDDFPAYIQERIINMPLLPGNSIVIDVMGTQLPLSVVNVKPKGVVRVTQDTEIVISKKPVKAAGVSPGIRYEDIGGLKAEIEMIREMIETPMKHPEVFKKLGISPPKGVLLYGPPGTGKTLLAKAVANETDAHFISLNGPEIMSKYYGQSEENLRGVFKEAQDNAPAIIFIDEIDSIAPRRGEVTGEVERRVVAQLLAMMDGLKERGQVVVIGATNREEAIDPALRRPGRFDREIEIGVPDRAGRVEILQVHVHSMPVADDVNLESLADRMHGFVGADINALCKEAAMRALRRYLPDLTSEDEIPQEIINGMQVKAEDFEEALKEIEPSSMREVLVELRGELTNSRVPTEGRWMIVPPWFYGMLLKEDRFVSAEKAGTAAGLRNGQVGQAAGFTILQSHNVPNTAGEDYKVMFGTSRAITFANQIAKIEGYRVEKRFADAVKGLNVYGAKVVRPEALGVLTCQPTA